MNEGNVRLDLKMMLRAETMAARENRGASAERARALGWRGRGRGSQHRMMMVSRCAKRAVPARQMPCGQERLLEVTARSGESDAWTMNTGRGSRSGASIMGGTLTRAARMVWPGKETSTQESG